MRLAPDGLAGWILQELIVGEFEFSTTLLVLEGKILDWAGMKYCYSMEAYVWPHVRLVDQELCSVPLKHREIFERFLVGFSGICNFNFKLREDQSLCIFEVNPRARKPSPAQFRRSVAGWRGFVLRYSKAQGQ